MPPSKVRKIRRDCQYTAEERSIIDPYKQEYRSQNSAECRGHIFKAKILPAIFGYWAKDGPGSMSDEEVENRVKTLGRWLANNWRPYATSKASKSTIKITKIEMVWRTCKEEVEAELRRILNVDFLDRTAPAYFQNRTAAAKRVYDQMDDQRKLHISQLVEEFKVKGNAPEIREKLAAKTSSEKVKKWSEKCWLEMGVFTMTFFAFFRADGKFVIDIYENSAKQIGVDAEPFTRLHKDKVQAMQRQFIDYVRDLKNLHDLPLPTSQKPDKICIGMTPNGYPVVPDAPFGTIKKDDLEDMMRQYLGMHYKLASGRRSHRVPYGTWGGTSKFVHEQYLPPGFKMKDPHNLKKDDIHDFFEHLKKRQDLHTAEHAFRFSCYLKGSKLYPAKYPDGQTGSSNIGDKAGSTRQGSNDVTPTMHHGTGSINATPTMHHGTGSINATQMHHGTGSADITSINTTQMHHGTGSTDITALYHNAHSPYATPGTSGTNTVPSNSDTLPQSASSQSEDLVIIGQGEMMALSPYGIPTRPAINGPNDGPPQYMATTAELGLLQSGIQTLHDAKDQLQSQVDDAATSRSFKGKHCLTRADKVASEEAQQFLNPKSKNRRSKRRK